MKTTVIVSYLMVFLLCAPRSFVELRSKPAPVFNNLATSAISEDSVVLNAALSHFATLRVTEFYNAIPDAGLIVLRDKTSPTPIKYEFSQMSGELEKEKTLTPALINSFHKRNIKSVSLRGIQSLNKKVVVDNWDKYPQGWEFRKALQKRHPEVIAFAWAWLPGYSKDAKQALVRFGFGPTAHGASVTYLLIKRNGVWSVKWHDLAFYA